MQTIESRLKSEFYANPSVKIELEKQLKALDENRTTPFEAAEKLLNLE
jgi:LAO/AO transport system kinase